MAQSSGVPSDAVTLKPRSRKALASLPEPQPRSRMAAPGASFARKRSRAAERSAETVDAAKAEAVCL